MRPAITSLLIILLSGCQGTNTITEYQYHETTKVPNAAYLVKCELPFKAPPKTYGEAVTRDEVWLNAFRLCACKIEKNREFYGYSNKNSVCSSLDMNVGK
ncbi:Rz1-like lysis system protein LysC [Vibrio casei]